jgi:hypothetical protein
MDGNTLMSLALEWGPAILIVLLAAWVLMAIWRFLKRLFGFDDTRSRGAAVPPQPQPVEARREPLLGSPQPAVSTIPDAADVLALKASIDALTRQIGVLEKRLAPAEPVLPAAEVQPATQGGEVIPIPIDPVPPSERRKS